MQRWREAQSEKEREIIADYYGTRRSAFEILPYFKFSTQTIPDPMHAFYHRIVHLFIRNALNLTTLSRTVPLPHESDIAFYHNFLPPPRPNPSQISSKSRTSEEYLAYLEWHDLLLGEEGVRLSRINDWLWPTMEVDTRALGDVIKGHQYLCQRRPTTAERKLLSKKLMGLRWHSLVYICNDLWISPVKDLLEETKFSKNTVTRKEMAQGLLDWRVNDINEDGIFAWPCFTMKNRPNPIAPWAHPLAVSIPANDASIQLDDQDRQTALLNLVNTFNYDSSVRVGHIHRYLCQPLRDQDKLEKSLETATMDALMYVCLDLNRVPRTPASGKMTKELLIRALVHWVRALLQWALSMVTDDIVPASPEAH
ncbi:hypothetical protein F5880DRAFT_1619585 [Lentinula raphanica]|nr:hypothetical protein F5880DRAFT_1619585 [Lentinula raphanica]